MAQHKLDKPARGGFWRWWPALLGLFLLVAVAAVATVFGDAPTDFVNPRGW